jgi:hypothetical protein
MIGTIVICAVGLLLVSLWIASHAVLDPASVFLRTHSIAGPLIDAHKEELGHRPLSSIRAVAVRMFMPLVMVPVVLWCVHRAKTVGLPWSRVLSFVRWCVVDLVCLAMLRQGRAPQGDMDVVFEDAHQHFCPWLVFGTCSCPNHPPG